MNLPSPSGSAPPLPAHVSPKPHVSAIFSIPPQRLKSQSRLSEGVQRMQRVYDEIARLGVGKSFPIAHCRVHAIVTRGTPSQRRRLHCMAVSLQYARQTDFHPPSFRRTPSCDVATKFGRLTVIVSALAHSHHRPHRRRPGPRAPWSNDPLGGVPSTRFPGSACAPASTSPAPRATAAQYRVARSLRLPHTTNTTRVPSDLHHGGGGGFPCPHLTRLPPACPYPRSRLLSPMPRSSPPRHPAPARLDGVQKTQGSAGVRLFPCALDLRLQSRTAPLQIPLAACPRRPPSSRAIACIPLHKFRCVSLLTYLPLFTFTSD
ncbi:hypothetical protein B0H13DRAFT_1083799 [Mycena leptocephala]|nr:hypothetical protein B0H13DRAFT_1083799 [Mycena leptocephala]